MRQKKYLTVLDPLQEKFGDFMTGILLLGELFAELMWGASILIALGKTTHVLFNSAETRNANENEFKSLKGKR